MVVKAHILPVDSCEAERTNSCGSWTPLLLVMKDSPEPSEVALEECCPGTSSTLSTFISWLLLRACVKLSPSSDLPKGSEQYVSMILSL